MSDQIAEGVSSPEAVAIDPQTERPSIAPQAGVFFNRLADGSVKVGGLVYVGKTPHYSSDFRGVSVDLNTFNQIQRDVQRAALNGTKQQRSNPDSNRRR